MKTIQNTKRLLQSFEHLREHFTEMPSTMRLIEFEKGELLNSPLKPLDQFLIPVEGSISIYDLSAAGAIRYVARIGCGTLLGDIEFSGAQMQMLYCEAAECVLCLAIPFQENKLLLENDPRFLRFVLNQLAEKLSLSATIGATAQTLEEKVLFYLKKIQPNHEISSVTQALQPLHCSRRQLQRVLKKLCDGGLLIKSGRGCYRLK